MTNWRKWGTCWWRWPRWLRGFWQGYCFLDASSRCGQHFLASRNSKRNHWITWNPADEVIDVSNDEDVDEEIEDPERIKSASNTFQVMNKVTRFSHQFDNEELRESIVKVIESPPNFEKTPDKNNNILYKEINSHVVINQLFFYFELFIYYRQLQILQSFSVLPGFFILVPLAKNGKNVSVKIINVR